LLCDIVKIAVAIYATSLGIAKLMNLGDYRKVTLPITWLMIALSTITFGNTVEFLGWSQIYFYFALPFQILLPLILWLRGEGRKNKSAA
jgi:spore germination protein KB